MNWGSAENFFAMGGQGFFVWGAYVVTLALMVIEPLLAAKRRRAALAASNSQDLDEEQEA